MNHFVIIGYQPAYFDLEKHGSLAGLKFKMPVSRQCWLLRSRWL